MKPKLPPRNSYAAMGFEAKFNQDYARFATRAATPYQQLAGMVEAGMEHVSNGHIGRHFGRTPQAARKWRMAVEQIQTKGL